MFLMFQPLLSPASAGLEALLKASSDDSCFGGGPVIFGGNLNKTSWKRGMHRKVPPESGKPALACKFQKYWPQDWHHQIIMVWNFVLSPNGSHDIFNLSSCPVMVKNNKDLLRKRNAPKGANQSLVSSFGMFTSRIWVIQPGMKIFVWKQIFV